MVSPLTALLDAAGLILRDENWAKSMKSAELVVACADGYVPSPAGFNGRTEARATAYAFGDKWLIEPVSVFCVDQTSFASPSSSCALASGSNSDTTDTELKPWGSVYHSEFSCGDGLQSKAEFVCAPSHNGSFAWTLNHPVTVCDASSGVVRRRLQADCPANFSFTAHYDSTLTVTSRVQGVSGSPSQMDLMCPTGWFPRSIYTSDIYQMDSVGWIDCGARVGAIQGWWINAETFCNKSMCKSGTNSYPDVGSTSMSYKTTVQVEYQDTVSATSLSCPPGFQPEKDSAPGVKVTSCTAVCESPVTQSSLGRLKCSDGTYCATYTCPAGTYTYTTNSVVMEVVTTVDVTWKQSTTAQYSCPTGYYAYNSSGGDALSGLVYCDKPSSADATRVGQWTKTGSNAYNRRTCWRQYCGYVSTAMWVENMPAGTADVDAMYVPSAPLIYTGAAPASVSFSCNTGYSAEITANVGEPTSTVPHSCLDGLPNATDGIRVFGTESRCVRYQCPAGGAAMTYSYDTNMKHTPTTAAWLDYAADHDLECHTGHYPALMTSPDVPQWTLSVTCGTRQLGNTNGRWKTSGYTNQLRCQKVHCLAGPYTGATAADMSADMLSAGRYLDVVSGESASCGVGYRPESGAPGNIITSVSFTCGAPTTSRTHLGIWLPQSGECRTYTCLGGVSYGSTTDSRLTFQSVVAVSLDAAGEATLSCSAGYYPAHTSSPDTLFTGTVPITCGERALNTNNGVWFGFEGTPYVCSPAICNIIQQNPVLGAPATWTPLAALRHAAGTALGTVQCGTTFSPERTGVLGVVVSEVAASCLPSATLNDVEGVWGDYDPTVLCVTYTCPPGSTVTSLSEPTLTYTSLVSATLDTAGSSSLTCTVPGWYPANQGYIDYVSVDDIVCGLRLAGASDGSWLPRSGHECVRSRCPVTAATTTVANADGTLVTMAIGVETDFESTATATVSCPVGYRPEHTTAVGTVVSSTSAYCYAPPVQQVEGVWGLDGSTFTCATYNCVTTPFTSAADPTLTYTPINEVKLDATSDSILTCPPGWRPQRGSDPAMPPTGEALCTPRAANAAVGIWSAEADLVCVRSECYPQTAYQVEANADGTNVSLLIPSTKQFESSDAAAVPTCPSGYRPEDSTSIGVVVSTTTVTCNAPAVQQIEGLWGISATFSCATYNCNTDAFTHSTDPTLQITPGVETKLDSTATAALLCPTGYRPQLGSDPAYLDTTTITCGPRAAGVALGSWLYDPNLKCVPSRCDASPTAVVGDAVFSIPATIYFGDPATAASAPVCPPGTRPENRSLPTALVDATTVTCEAPPTQSEFGVWTANPDFICAPFSCPVEAIVEPLTPTMTITAPLTVGDETSGASLSCPMGFQPERLSAFEVHVPFLAVTCRSTQLLNMPTSTPGHFEWDIEDIDCRPLRCNATNLEDNADAQLIESRLVHGTMDKVYASYTAIATLDCIEPSILRSGLWEEDVEFTCGIHQYSAGPDVGVDYWGWEPVGRSWMSICVRACYIPRLSTGVIAAAPFQRETYQTHNFENELKCNAGFTPSSGVVKEAYCDVRDPDGANEAFWNTDFENFCEDLDECATGVHQCHPLRDCVNTYGSYDCFCKAGYDDFDGVCDWDECLAGEDNCFPGEGEIRNGSAICTNVLGGFRCDCPIYWWGSGRTCEPSTCWDDRQSGDEEGIDCGGSCPDACIPCPSVPSSPNVTSDFYFSENKALYQCKQPTLTPSFTAAKCTRWSYKSTWTPNLPPVCSIGCPAGAYPNAALTGCVQDTIPPLTTPGDPILLYADYPGGGTVTIPESLVQLGVLDETQVVTTMTVPGYLQPVMLGGCPDGKCGSVPVGGRTVVFTSTDATGKVTVSEQRVLVFPIVPADIDECALKLHSCPYGTYCKDVPGQLSPSGFTCVAEDYLEYDPLTNKVTVPGDISEVVDECTLKRHGCHEYGECSDLEYGYTCSCQSGYKGDGIFCEPSRAVQLSDMLVTSTFLDTTDVLSVAVMADAVAAVLQHEISDIAAEDAIAAGRRVLLSTRTTTHYLDDSAEATGSDLEASVLFQATVQASAMTSNVVTLLIGNLLAPRVETLVLPDGSSVLQAVPTLTNPTKQLAPLVEAAVRVTADLQTSLKTNAHVASASDMIAAVDALLSLLSPIADENVLTSVSPSFDAIAEAAAGADELLLQSLKEESLAVRQGISDSVLGLTSLRILAQIDASSEADATSADHGGKVAWADRPLNPRTGAAIPVLRPGLVQSETVGSFELSVGAFQMNDTGLPLYDLMDGSGVLNGILAYIQTNSPLESLADSSRPSSSSLSPTDSGDSAVSFGSPFSFAKEIRSDTASLPTRVVGKSKSKSSLSVPAGNFKADVPAPSPDLVEEMPTGCSHYVVSSSAWAENLFEPVMESAPPGSAMLSLNVLGVDCPGYADRITPIEYEKLPRYDSVIVQMPVPAGVPKGRALCGFYSPAEAQIGYQGCLRVTNSESVLDSSPDGSVYISCECSHLTDFGAMFQDIIMQSNLNLLGRIGELQFHPGNVAFWVVFAFTVLVFLVFAWAIWKDFKYPITDYAMLMVYLNDKAVIDRINGQRAPPVTALGSLFNTAKIILGKDDPDDVDANVRNLQVARAVKDLQAKQQAPSAAPAAGRPSPTGPSSRHVDFSDLSSSTDPGSDDFIAAILNGTPVVPNAHSGFTGQKAPRRSHTSMHAHEKRPGATGIVIRSDDSPDDGEFKYLMNQVLNAQRDKLRQKQAAAATVIARGWRTTLARRRSSAAAASLSPEQHAVTPASTQPAPVDRPSRSGLLSPLGWTPTTAAASPAGGSPLMNFMDSLGKHKGAKRKRGAGKKGGQRKVHNSYDPGSGTVEKSDPETTWPHMLRLGAKMTTPRIGTPEENPPSRRHTTSRSSNRRGKLRMPTPPDTPPPSNFDFLENVNENFVSTPATLAGLGAGADPLLSLPGLHLLQPPSIAAAAVPVGGGDMFSFFDSPHLPGQVAPTFSAGANFAVSPAALETANPSRGVSSSTSASKSGPHRRHLHSGLVANDASAVEKLQGSILADDNAHPATSVSAALKHLEFDYDDLYGGSNGDAVVAMHDHERYIRHDFAGRRERSRRQVEAQKETMQRALDQTEDNVALVVSKGMFVQWSLPKLFLKTLQREHPIAGQVVGFRRSSFQQALKYGSSALGALFLLAVFFGADETAIPDYPEGHKSPVEIEPDLALVTIPMPFDTSFLGPFEFEGIEITAKGLMMSIVCWLLSQLFPTLVDWAFNVETPLIERLEADVDSLSYGINALDGTIPVSLMTVDEQVRWLKKVKRRSIFGVVAGSLYSLFCLFFLFIFSLALGGNFENDERYRQTSDFFFSAAYTNVMELVLWPMGMAFMFTLLIKFVFTRTNKLDKLAKLNPHWIDFPNSLPGEPRDIKIAQIADSTDISAVVNLQDSRENAKVLSSKTAPLPAVLPHQNLNPLTGTISSSVPASIHL